MAHEWTAQAKLKIVLETVGSDQKPAEICRREGVSPNQVYEWRRRLLGSADAVFARKDRAGPDPRIEKPASENTRMKNVIAEITAENLELKKRSRTERPRPASDRVATRGAGAREADPTTQPPAEAAHAEGPGDSAGRLLSPAGAAGTLRRRPAAPTAFGAGHALRIAGVRTPAGSGLRAGPPGSAASRISLENAG